MTPIEILKKLKETFNEVVKNADATGQTPAQTPANDQKAPDMVTPIKAKLKDGTEVEITELGVGGIVSINGQPAPAGDHELEDGTIISVGDNGAITAMTPSQSAPPAVEDMGAKFSAFETSTNEKFASYEQKFADYETKFANYESRLNGAIQTIETLLQVTTKIAETPTGTPDASVKTNNQFKEQKQESYDILFS